MKKWLITLSFFSSTFACADNIPTNAFSSVIKEEGFYLKIGFGASISMESKISAPPSVWDPAIQGYNDDFGSAPILLGGLGYDSPGVSTDLTISYRPNFSYSKFQTPSTSTTPGELGSTTRKFNLDVSSLMQTLYLNGRGISWLNWKVQKSSSIFPFIGGGIGVSQLKIFNFRSTGLPPVEDPFPSFASENQYCTKYRFAFQLLGGLEYRYKDVCALSAGYRWFKTMRFDGPRYVRDSEGNAIDVQSKPWRIGFSANEAFIEFKVFL